ncbi:hypothetical protein FMM68_04015 [Lachnospiraceae bacterium MD329]|nr:hypothetical protein [Lachnospiraceae bacterium MD329]
MAAKTTNKNVTEDKQQENISVEETQTVNSAQDNTESQYTIDELMAAEKELDANKVIIRTALNKTEKTLFTVKEAKDIVAKFKNKKVN